VILIPRVTEASLLFDNAGVNGVGGEALSSVVHVGDLTVMGFYFKQSGAAPEIELYVRPYGNLKDRGEVPLASDSDWGAWELIETYSGVKTVWQHSPVGISYGTFLQFKAVGITGNGSDTAVTLRFLGQRIGYYMY